MQIGICDDALIMCGLITVAVRMDSRFGKTVGNFPAPSHSPQLPPGYLTVHDVSAM